MTLRMALLEVLCVAIVALFLVVRGRRHPRPHAFLSRMALLALAGLLAEEGVMRAYGFYQYDIAWFPFVCQLPLLVALIWPVVIHSAWDMARLLLPARPGLVPLVGALFVLADAALIEPVAVRAGLWSWNEPGLFGVPPIGVLGWAYFAFLALWLLGRRPRWQLLLPVVPPLVVHAPLLASWWGLLRWISQPVPAWPAAIALLAVAAVVSACCWRAGLRRRLPLDVMLPRMPAAGFFFLLLALYGRDPALWVYACAFVPPYLSLTGWHRDPRLPA